jgi:hypothetical protein
MLAELAPERSAVELGEQRARVEALVGRPLRQAEQAIDVLGLDTALGRAKDELARAIEAEKRRAIRRRMRVGGLRIQLTPAMLAPLERLFRLGRREARAELQRLGYEIPRRALASEPHYDELAEVAALMREALYRLQLNVERRYASVQFSEATTASMIRALYTVPGARDIASRVVSSALTAGLGATFEHNAGLVGGWEYTAVLDGHTCGECESLDGETYDTWEAIQEVLPGGGPNPSCSGGGRCRCRAVPAAA